MSKYRGGITPIQTNENLPFIITTANVQEYLQKRINAAINVARHDAGLNVPDINVTVNSIPLTDSFMPFFILLPMKAIVNGDSKVKNNPKNYAELSIFHSDVFNEKSSKIKIQQHIHLVLRPYFYEKNDIEALKNRNVVKHPIRPSSINKIRHEDRYKIHKFGDKAYVTVILDPIKIFMDMLCTGNERLGDCNFQVWVDKIKKLNGGNVSYKLTREEIRHEKTYNNNLSIAQITRRMFR